MKRLIFLLLFLILLISCNSEINLDSEKKIELSFNQLPKDLKKIYSTKHIVANDTTIYYVISLDKNYELSHYWTGRQKQFITKGFYHHFTIKGKNFKLKANQGNPFILKNKKFYYTTELNLTKDNFKRANYIEIDLADYLNY